MGYGVVTGLVGRGVGLLRFSLSRVGLVRRGGVIGPLVTG
jgi:hypothetical protein